MSTFLPQTPFQKSWGGHTGNLVAAVGGLGDLFGSAGQDLEVLAGNNDVVAVVAARGLAAIGTVAQSLCERQQSIIHPRANGRVCLSLRSPADAYRHHRLPGVFDLDLSAKTASGRHRDWVELDWCLPKIKGERQCQVYCVSCRERTVW